jgi:hypothetical protein
MLLSSHISFGRGSCDKAVKPQSLSQRLSMVGPSNTTKCHFLYVLQLKTLVLLQM